MTRILRRVRDLSLALALSLAVAACAAESADDAPDAGDMAVEAVEHDGQDGGAESREAGQHSEGSVGGEHSEGGEGGEGQHGGEAHDDEGEEGDGYISEAEAWDQTRRGARLQLTYDPGYELFMGRVVNTTDSRLCSVRVEVHLEGGPELGPTEPADVEPGASLAVELATEGARFERFTAHPEMSPCG